MVSTHMGYGFVLAYFLSSFSARILFPGASSAILSLNVCFVLAGLAGGLLPDVDRLEQIGLSHRKSLHYVVGYGILSIVLMGVAFVVARDLVVWMVALSCFFAGAWLHSFMDIFDGFWADDVNKGVYEHLRKRWIRALNWIPFADLREWSLQSFSTAVVVGISPQLTAVMAIPGWSVALISFLAVWIFSSMYEFRRTVPTRRGMERRTLKKLGLQPQA
jgi:hypothetical protein